jgi:glutathione S-transferase
MGIARWNDFHRVIDRADYPRVQALYERLLQDPGVRFAHAVEHEQALPASTGFQGHVPLDQAVRSVSVAA